MNNETQNKQDEIGERIVKLSASIVHKRSPLSALCPLPSLLLLIGEFSLEAARLSQGAGA